MAKIWYLNGLVIESADSLWKYLKANDPQTMDDMYLNFMVCHSRHKSIDVLPKVLVIIMLFLILYSISQEKLPRCFGSSFVHNITLHLKKKHRKCNNPIFAV